MAPPPLPLFSPSLKAPPPPPWLHGSSTQSRDSAPPVPPLPAEATPSKFRIDSPKPAPARKNTKTAAKPLTAGVPGGRTHRAVLGIIRRVRSLELSDAPSPNSVHTSNSGAAAAAFHLTIELSPPREPGQYVVEKEKSRAVPWAAARDEGLKVALRREKKPREPTRAETELETHELHRLRRLARGIGRWARAKKAGVTDEVVKEVRREWASGEELAAVRIVEPLRRSMDRAREILEIKTGGLVVWTKGDMHFVYRGSKYQQNAKHSHTFLTNVHKGYLVKHNVHTTLLKYGSIGPVLINNYGEADDAFQENDQSICGQKDEEPVKGTLYEREVNRLLDTLGPRFVDWWWDTPLPVDADLLPEFVPGFKTPYRLCPPGVRPTLADEELTYLRKLARLLPTHFALGRNTRLQGLAAAILKLWEKSLIAKIAVKIGIQNTNNEQMAWNLKHLTGGTVILRNKDFIILYRGKDFLPGGVAQTVIQREAQVHDEQVKEEEARLKAVDSLQMVGELSEESSLGTFREYQGFHAKFVHENTENSNTMIELEAEKYRLEKELKDHEWKLSVLNKKIERSNQALAKLHSSWSPSEQSADREHLTEEEKIMFRRIGRKMDGLVLLGRRGIFDGVIEEIHQHWKHKEVVKVITKQNQTRQIMYAASLLEVETVNEILCSGETEVHFGIEKETGRGM
ncbi:chloroplastic group IIA intron splicing facilitator CRS1, chloroplastic isoform X5 [Zea mays]|uniref:chloroplastic group IIA intron splicing facilitator CRS1, chloroplastic isoform X5 n=1 Tax=Zea mays TaxID=4577 RepID=UPI0004DE97FA|nr:chloroplastic group IIA intron splicing facilitator CRS1, chloroplastic isoform X5 [Zea mays]|eukprot:XP_008648232.1 chloroplastic group IIA intron splicing facilitator CRS1, chloroplastic isoform X5 [Zea mays]